MFLTWEVYYLLTLKNLQIRLENDFEEFLRQKLFRHDRIFRTLVIVKGDCCLQCNIAFVLLFYIIGSSHHGCEKVGGDLGNGLVNTSSVVPSPAKAILEMLH